MGKYDFIVILFKEIYPWTLQKQYSGEILQIVFSFVYPAILCYIENRQSSPVQVIFSTQFLRHNPTNAH